MIKNYWKKGAKQKTFLIILSIIIILALFILRDDYQPFLLFLRKYIFIVLLFLGILYFGIRSLRKAQNFGKKIVVGIVTFLSIGIIYALGWNVGMYQYLQTYNVFKSMKLQEIAELPLTMDNGCTTSRRIFYTTH